MNRRWYQPTDRHTAHVGWLDLRIGGQMALSLQGGAVAQLVER